MPTPDAMSIPANSSGDAPGTLPSSVPPTPTSPAMCAVRRTMPSQRRPGKSPWRRAAPPVTSRAALRALRAAARAQLLAEHQQETQRVLVLGFLHERPQAAHATARGGSTRALLCRAAHAVEQALDHVEPVDQLGQHARHALQRAGGIQALQNLHHASGAAAIEA